MKREDTEVKLSILLKISGFEGFVKSLLCPQTENFHKIEKFSMTLEDNTEVKEDNTEVKLRSWHFAGNVRVTDHSGLASLSFKVVENVI